MISTYYDVCSKFILKETINEKNEKKNHKGEIISNQL